MVDARPPATIPFTASFLAVARITL